MQVSLGTPPLAHSHPRTQGSGRNPAHLDLANTIFVQRELIVPVWTKEKDLNQINPEISTLAKTVMGKGVSIIFILMRTDKNSLS